MRKWLWIAPIVLLAGCSKNSSNVQAAHPDAGSPTAMSATVPAPSPAAATPATAEAPPPAAEVAPDPDPEPARGTPEVATTVIPRGTSLRVRLEETVSTKSNNAGDRFTATLTSPVRVNGRMVLRAGTPVHGHVVEADNSGRLKGRARLVLALDSFEHGGKRYAIRTGSIARVSESHKNRNIIGIGGGSAIGAAIGAIAGGGKGALIGAGAGAGAGAVGAAATGKKHVTLPAETVLSFRLGAPVRV